MDDPKRHTLCHTTASEDKRLVRQQEGAFHYMCPDAASSGKRGPVVGLSETLVVFLCYFLPQKLLIFGGCPWSLCLFKWPSVF